MSFGALSHVRFGIISPHTEGLVRDDDDPEKVWTSKKRKEAEAKAEKLAKADPEFAAYLIVQFISDIAIKDNGDCYVTSFSWKDKDT